MNGAASRGLRHILLRSRQCRSRSSTASVMGARCVSEAIGASIDTRTGEICAAMNRARVVAEQVRAKSVAIGRVVKSVRDVQIGIERKQKRQPAGLARIDVFFATPPPPVPSQSRVVVSHEAKYDRGRVMQKASECVAAELLIILRVQNEFVPQVIGYLRGHRDELPRPLRR